MKTLLFLLLAAALLVSGCESEGQRTVKEAEAREIDRQSQADLEAAQADLEAAQAEEIRRQEQFERDQVQERERYESTRAAYAFAKRVFFLTVSLSLAAAVSLLFAIVVFRIWGISKAVNKKVALWSMQTPMDATTGSYPLLTMRGAIHNPNNGLVLSTGDPRDPDRQLVTGSEYTRALTVATEGARQIAKATKNAQAADVIFTAAGSIPLIGDGPFARERETVAASPLPQVVKDFIDARIAQNERIIHGETT